MSGSTRKRLIVAGVLTLVCGLVGFGLLTHQPSPELTFTLEGFERNHYGVLMARILVTNSGPHTFKVGTAGYKLHGVGDIRPLERRTAGIWTAPVTTFGPCEVSLTSQRVYTSSVIDRARSFLYARLHKRDFDTHTLQVRE